MTPGGEQFEMVRKRKFPLVGNGAGVWSFIHIADAAEATVAAVERGERGTYNVVDDDPAPVADWLPALAGRIGALAHLGPVADFVSVQSSGLWAGIPCWCSESCGHGSG